MMKFGFIGMGNMGYAMLKGALNSFSSDEIIFTCPSSQRREYINSETNVAYAESNAECANNSKYIILAVKPQVYDVVLKNIHDIVSPDNIIYMVLDIQKIVVDYKHDFFFSDGHAYNHYSTRFFSCEYIDRIDDILDKNAIRSDQWGDDYVVKNNKQAEFFVKGDIELDTIVFYICHSNSCKDRWEDMGINPNMIKVSSRAYF